MERPEAATNAIIALAETCDQLVMEIEDAEAPSPERNARLEEIDAALQV